MSTLTNTRYVINNDGVKEAVIVQLDEYEALMEDLDDLAKAAERRNEPSISHEELLDELKQDGQI